MNPQGNRRDLPSIVISIFDSLLSARQALTQLQRIGSGERTTRKDELLRFGHPNQARSTLCTSSAWYNPQANFGEADLGHISGCEKHHLYETKNYDI